MKKFNKNKKPKSQRGAPSRRKSKFSDREKQHKKEIPKQTAPDFEDMRLNRYVAHCGICSRRKADEYIKAGKVQVNGETVIEPGHRVTPKDKVQYEGKYIRPERNLVYILMNKPKNYITTTSDERGRKTVMDIVEHKVKERIFPVGRLDRATMGLLLLTNDGDLAKKLSHPSHEIQKIYHIVLDKDVEEEHLQQIAEGITLDDGKAPVDSVYYYNNKDLNECLIEVHIGRNRIVRRIFEHFGYVVKKLDRVYYAGLTKKDLPRGWFRHLTEQEIIMLKHFK